LPSVTAAHSAERVVALADLGERLAALRLADAAALSAMRTSLARHGQLSPVRAFECDGQLEVFDGFKRLRAARGLGLGELFARVVDVDVVEATVHMRELHAGRGLTPLEEGWMVRALYRDCQLSQGAIAARLRCHKTWVCRRLMLVEALDSSVQADVRLGLLAARAAVLVSALPRGNQTLAAGVVIRRGLTVCQTARLVRELIDAAEPATQQAVLQRWQDHGAAAPPRPGIGSTRGVAETMTRDIAMIRRSAGRLHSCLVTTPLAALESGAADVVRESLGELAGVLRALEHTVTGAIASSTTPEVA
jgi:ParB-like chromosome segregation protein Spo0J